jgi:hypothetical protein
MNEVRAQSAEVLAMAPGWAKVDALMGGTDAMRAAGEMYLPKWTREDPQSYQYRLKTSTLFNCFRRTVAGLSGKPFVRPIAWTDDVPAPIVDWFPNIDLTGRNLHVFAHEVFLTGLAYGLTHVLVDYPRVEGVKTVADEKAIGARPYLIHIKPTSILGWRSEKQKGIETLIQLRILECVKEPDGDFAVKSVDQVRVLEPGTWATYRYNAEKDEWYLHEEGETSFPTIPLVTYYTGRTGFMTADSPLIDIADLNIEHWQISSDKRSVLHTASVPILALIGIESNADGSPPVTVGAKSAIMLPQGATAHYVEHTGKAVDAGRQALQDLEEQMRLMGAELLVKKPGQATATQATLDTSQQRSELQSLTAEFEDYVDQVIQIMADWAKIPMKGDIQVYSDFLLAADDAVQETLMLSIVNAGLMSRQTFFEAMQRRDVYDPDLTWEDEQERIASEPPLGGMPTASAPPVSVLSSSQEQALNG